MARLELLIGGQDGQAQLCSQESTENPESEGARQGKGQRFTIDSGLLGAGPAHFSTLPSPGWVRVRGGLGRPHHDSH